VSQRKIKIGISSCLLGQEVRFDGGHKHDRFISGTLSQYFEFLPVCPELAIGLGVPRKPIHLRGSPEQTRVISHENPDRDLGPDLRTYGEKMAEEMPDICGYIFKSRSPSCGMERVKLFGDRDAPPSKEGIGQYAASFMTARPLLPYEEEGRLNDPILRENFVERVFTYRRWQEFRRGKCTMSGLVEFHTRHKLAVMSHGVVAYRKLGRIVANAEKRSAQETADIYITELMAALTRRATRRAHTNVLQHIQGFLKRNIDREDKKELVEVIESYRLGHVPLIVPVTLLRHHFRRQPDPFIAQQTYLNPHPPELMLRNLL
jgi:uncharacterized protein YbgA (DUF1722 family)/uncharacterized protein YbbK (DUF523 family)